MIKHKDYCTHIDNPEDWKYLKTTLFDVNMRLFRSSPGYRTTVQKACRYIQYCAMTEKEGYKKPHGYSGANAGIPWNIIAYMAGNIPVVMINPKVVTASPEMKEVKSNCGSLTLKNSIAITRNEYVTVSYYDMEGIPRVEEFGPTPGFTIQHEIEHNLGILITDKEVPK